MTTSELNSRTILKLFKERGNFILATRAARNFLAVDPSSIFPLGGLRFTLNNDVGVPKEVILMMNASGLLRLEIGHFSIISSLRNKSDTHVFVSESNTDDVDMSVLAELVEDALTVSSSISG